MGFCETVVFSKRLFTKALNGFLHGLMLPAPHINFKINQKNKKYPHDLSHDSYHIPLSSSSKKYVSFRNLVFLRKTIPDCS